MYLILCWKLLKLAEFKLSLGDELQSVKYKFS